MHNRPENISRNQYFEKLSSSLINWVEKLNGRVIGRFVLINQNPSKTILRSIDRENFYIELNNETAKWGRSPNVIHSVFEYGSWVEFYSTGNGGKNWDYSHSSRVISFDRSSNILTQIYTHF
jgi:hypothetical protein